MAIDREETRWRSSQSVNRYSSPAAICIVTKNSTGFSMTSRV